MTGRYCSRNRGMCLTADDCGRTLYGCMDQHSPTREADNAQLQFALENSEKRYSKLEAEMADAKISIQAAQSVASHFEALLNAAPQPPQAERAGLVAAAEFLVDVLDDAKNPEEHRTYVGGSYDTAISEIRASLAATPQAERVPMDSDHRKAIMESAINSKTGMGDMEYASWIIDATERAHGMGAKS